MIALDLFSASRLRRICNLGCMPKGSYDNTRNSRKGSEKVLGRVPGKGSSEGFFEGGSPRAWQ